MLRTGRIQPGDRDRHEKGAQRHETDRESLALAAEIRPRQFHALLTLLERHPQQAVDGLDLLRAMDELGHPFETLGVPGYPEGHADISDARLLEVLLEKQRYASYTATQMCFDPAAIVRWIAEMRRQGVSLAVHLGTPGVAELTKLMAISARIGVADSARYLKKNKRMLGKLLTPGKFGPDALLEGMAPAIADPSANIESLHVFTFNQVAATVEWQGRMLASLDRA